jgi:UPF0176 protein
MENSVVSEKVLRTLNIAFYKFVELNDLSQLRTVLREECQKREIKGSILISTEGLNGSLAGLESQIRDFQQFLASTHFGAGLEYKESFSSYVPFQKLFIKIKKEIIPVGDSDVRPAEFTAPRISPAELRLWLDEQREFDLLDTRNDYEIEYGTFEKAKHLGLKHFRHFSDKLEAMEKDPAKPLVMFCTGGIRCEKASVIALKKGFKEVYQLEGGILKYFEECGDQHYQGNCFVFDERVAVNSNLEENQTKISRASSVALDS